MESQERSSTYEQLGKLLTNNKAWSSSKLMSDKLYFEKLVNIQTPQYLWIGCSDSRVPANQIVGLQPGQLFVHRNVANLVSPADINCCAVITYAVEVLKVKHIIITGHYGCGGVMAALQKKDHGVLQTWLSQIRAIKEHRHMQLKNCTDAKKKMVELNVIHQVMNTSRISSVQAAWQRKQDLTVHGMVYSLQNGLLKVVCPALRNINQVPQQSRIY